MARFRVRCPGYSLCADRPSSENAGHHPVESLRFLERRLAEDVLPCRRNSCVEGEDVPQTGSGNPPRTSVFRRGNGQRRQRTVGARRGQADKRPNCQAEGLGSERNPLTARRVGGACHSHRIGRFEEEQVGGEEPTIDGRNGRTDC